MKVLKQRGILYLIVFTISLIVLKTISHQLDWPYEKFGELIDPMNLPLAVIGFYLYADYFDRKKKISDQTYHPD